MKPIAFTLLAAAFFAASLRAEEPKPPECNCKPLAVTIIPAAGNRAAGARAQAAVPIANFSYGKDITINVGDSIVWTNTDSAPHTATSDTPLFDTGTLNTNQSSKAFQFNTAGTFPYHCTIHPFMVGNVIVKAAAGGAPVLTNLTATATVGAAFSYTITATGDQPISFLANLPEGFTLNGAIINGVFSAAGTVNIPLTATNAAGSDSQNLVVTVSAAGVSAGLTGDYKGKAKLKPFSLTGVSPKSSSVLVDLNITDASGALTATVTIGDKTITATGQSGNNNLWLTGGTTDTLVLSGHLKKTALSGTAIIYSTTSVHEITFSAKK